MRERPNLPNLLTESALCIVSMNVVDGSTVEGRVLDGLVGSTAELGVPCVILGGLAERDTAFQLLRMGVRAITPLGHPRRSWERARLTCRDNLEWHAHHATIHFSLP